MFAVCLLLFRCHDYCELRASSNWSSFCSDSGTDAVQAAEQVGRPFLEALLAASTGEQAMRGWETIVRTAFADVKGAQLREAWRLDSKLLVLDRLLQAQPLQHTLVWLEPPTQPCPRGLDESCMCARCMYAAWHPDMNTA